MHDFLLWIGVYNLFGALVLPVFAIRPAFADRFLSTWIEVTAPPYDHGKHGPLWVWWSALVNLFLGVVMVLATRWPAAIQAEVCLSVVAVYALMWLLAVLALSSPHYNRRGLWAVILVMWPVQMVWGLWVAFA